MLRSNQLDFDDSAELVVAADFRRLLFQQNYENISRPFCSNNPPLSLNVPFFFLSKLPSTQVARTRAPTIILVIYLLKHNDITSPTTKVQLTMVALADYHGAYSVGKSYTDRSSSRRRYL